MVEGKTTLSARLRDVSENQRISVQRGAQRAASVRSTDELKVSDSANVLGPHTAARTTEAAEAS